MAGSLSRRIAVLDSHTGGEPTRLVLEGGPDLGNGTLAHRLTIFRERHDRWRAAIVKEPRGSDVIVGALLARFTGRPVWFSAARQLAIASFAAAVTFLVGHVVGVGVG